MDTDMRQGEAVMKLISAKIQRNVRNTGFWTILVATALAACHEARAQVANQPTSPAPATPSRPITNEAEWIWSPAYKQDHVPKSECYFRKAFQVADVERAEIHIVADNAYELYVNGQLVGRGGDWRSMDVYDAAPHLKPGQNTVAVRAVNTDAGAAGMVARVLVHGKNGKYDAFSTDATWRTSVKKFVDWTQPQFRDSEWLPARSYGALGEVLPWGNEVVLAGLAREFQLADTSLTVEKILGENVTGSLISICFDHRGGILASREGAGIVRLIDTNSDTLHDRAEPYCDLVKNVQGMLPMGDTTYVTGQGPQGGGLYRLKDEDKDGQIDKADLLVKFRGSLGEHGPHAIKLGRDGKLYLLVGNFAAVDAPVAPKSPYATSYEGDAVGPRYEDPQGHAVGVPAPGGTIWSMDLSGKNLQRFAGGLRNPYDFVLTHDGELVTYDADMEWDQGAPWYRPTRLLHVVAGGEYGWRSGWAKWPEYYLDNLPGIKNLGPGSPAGMVLYDHYAFPEKYHGAIFAADWARGTIQSIRLRPEGGTLSAEAEIFLRGTPLNVTDLEVGPGGSLYFCTGGRGTEGALYRVRGRQLPKPQLTGIETVLRQPQIDSAWAQTEIARQKKQLGSRWETELVGAAQSTSLRPAMRVRALEVMQLYGPRPSANLLQGLLNDSQPEVRAQALYLLPPAAAKSIPMTQWQKLLSDAQPRVRRRALETIARCELQLQGSLFLPLLEDPDRFVRFATMRTIGRQADTSWRQQVLAAGSVRAFAHGSVAILLASPQPSELTTILDRATRLLSGQQGTTLRPAQSITTADAVEIARVVELALTHEAIQPPEMLAQVLLQLYPTRNVALDRELIRLLARFHTQGATERIIAELKREDLSDEDKLHLAGHAKWFNGGWTRDHKIAWVDYFDRVRKRSAGYSVGAYIERFAREFFQDLTEEEKRLIVQAGAEWPSSALSVLAGLPEQVSPEMLALLPTLDQQLEGREENEIARLRVGIVAVLARSNDPGARQYLHQVYQDDPERRPLIAASLAQHPEGENWPLLVESLRSISDAAATEVLAALAQVQRKPQDADSYRHLILLAARDANNRELAVKLLTTWTGHSTEGDANSLDGYVQWFAGAFADEDPIQLVREDRRSKWSREELEAFLASPAGGAGDVQRGAAVFAAAQCAACHRHGTIGERMGPDLTTVANRFQSKEILASILEPSQVISDQYQAYSVEIGGRVLVGLAAQDGPDTIVLLDSSGQKRRIPRSEIDQISPATVSAMPSGLLNRLTLQQVADLFAFLKSDPQVARQVGGAPVR